jgi:hypothetical protein
MGIIKETKHMHVVFRMFVWGTEGRKFYPLRWKCKSVQPLWKSVQRFLKKTKNRTITFDLAASFLGIKGRKEGI